MPIITNKVFEKNIATIREDRALTQEIRPLKLAILNLMPDKETTEQHLMRVLSNTPLHLDITLLRTESYISTHVDPKYLEENYRVFSEVKDEKFDAFLVTGAPIELLEFEEIDYWRELCEILDYVKYNAYSTMFLCWASQAALKYYYGIEKYEFGEKLFGLFEYETRIQSDLTRGFDPSFVTPMSRYTYNKLEDIEAEEDLILYAGNEETGPNIVASKDHRFIFISGHFEYDKDTLKKEYERDQKAGKNTALPQNYFIDNNPNKGLQHSWNAHATLFFTNWLNNYVYQQTPYQLKELEPKVISKFGGSSLSDSKQFKKVKKIIEDADRKVIVVSAPGKRSADDVKITDVLISYYQYKTQRDEAIKANDEEQVLQLSQAMDKEIKNLKDRFLELILSLDMSASFLLEIENDIQDLENSNDYDFIVSRGEYLNAKVLAKYLDYDFLDAKEIIFFKDGEIENKKTYQAINEKIKKGKSYIIPGFYGADENNDVKLFGRGGSDITGSVIASALESETYENWTDVPGVMTSDPRKDKEATTIEKMSYRELYEIVSNGAEVFNPDAVKPLFGSKVILEIKNTDHPNDKFTKVESSEGEE